MLHLPIENTYLEKLTTGVQCRINGEPVTVTSDGEFIYYKHNRCKIIDTRDDGTLTTFCCASDGQDSDECEVIHPDLVCRIKQSLYEQDQLCEKTVEMYKREIEAGEELPPIVLADIDGETVIVDGLHRVKAIQECGVTHIKGHYRVSLPAEQLSKLRKDLNQHHLNN
ncbi:hypothetical protein SV7mr_19970 [Stieleria bergensis]|uniref:Uncharacterized protein n=1 Tax=Stieleria bergensis TaxID=2528025 RepID=A0A517STP9_9BACT|nr:hypothetical protein SV7mr_19970 [Planctomycetes bacterium SV_7m_r]